MKTTPDYEQYRNECREANVVPVTRQLLADQHTTVSLLQRFYNGPEGGREGVFLLESVEGGEKWGRYSFLGIDAHAFVEVHQDEIRIVEHEELGSDVSEEKGAMRPAMEKGAMRPATEKGAMRPAMEKGAMRPAMEKGAMRPAIRSIPHHGKPLECLREIMAQYYMPHHAELPRFFGGLVGYFTYEMVSFFEKIPHKLENEPFASFVIPRTLLIFDNAKQVLTVCVLTFPKRPVAGRNAPVAGRNAPVAGRDAPPCQKSPDALYRQAVRELDRIVAELERPMPTLQPRMESELSLMPVLSERDYRKRVEQIKQHIACGDIIQCVYSQPFVADEAPDAISLYRALRYANPAPYMFFMHLSGNVLAGSSPETMIRLEGRTATLRPIAGTRKRGATEQRDRELADEMLRDPKEKAEHLMLVDLGRNDLGRIAKTGTVQVTDLMFIERHSHVMHLVSNVTAELEDGRDGFDLFRATFPAGTLSGAPKVRAMQIIAEYETTPRGPYGGAAGYISFSGNIDFAITIRTARIKDGQLTAQSGGGIVYDSVPELERMETVNKAMGIEKALNILGGG